MNRLLLSLFLLLASLLQLSAQYVTVAPRVDDVNDRDVSIQRVELTGEYTIIYMKFQRGKEGAQPQDNRRSWPFSIPLPGGGNNQSEFDGSSSIGFQPDSRLYVNQGEKSFKLIRAENIPPETRRSVSPGERVDFIAYFERIDPGYTVFDLFECKDYVQGMSKITCFNFWGVHITNPKKKDAYTQRTPTPTPVPKPTPQPRYTPRTSPGVGTPAPKTEPTPTPTPVSVAINGVTRNVKTKKPVAATVSYQLISGAETTGNNPEAVQSVQPSGNYRISDVQRGVYALTVSADGYFSQTDTLATNRINITRNFDLVPIEVGTKLTLRNIYFDASKYDLKSESFPELDRLVLVMQNNPRLQIKLEGHTDTVGDFDANVELSRNRVSAVKRYLESKGISAGRIDTVGYGPSKPINTNRGLKERPENRRVEMVVVTV